MNLLHDPPQEFDGIRKAFAMAKLLPGTRRRGVRIGLAGGGVLLASGELDSYRQATFFADHLRILGWQEHLPGNGDEMHGCDMLFSPPPRAGASDDDPSFIRRPAVQLWPARG